MTHAQMTVAVIARRLMLGVAFSPFTACAFVEIFYPASVSADGQRLIQRQLSVTEYARYNAAIDRLIRVRQLAIHAHPWGSEQGAFGDLRG
jgi:hypothetical protein